MLLAPCSAVEAQQAMKMPKMGLLFATSPSVSPARVEAFRRGLRELGYQDGKNIVIEYRYAEGKLDRLPALASELIGLKVDVIVTTGGLSTRAAKEASTVVPVVMTQDIDPVANGFIASLARPGGNITGLCTLGPEISGKQLELLKEIVSKLARVAVLGTSANPGTDRAFKEPNWPPRRSSCSTNTSTCCVPTMLRPHFEPREKAGLRQWSCLFPPCSILSEGRSSNSRSKIGCPLSTRFRNLSKLADS